MNLKYTLFALLILSGLVLSAQTPSIVTQVSPAAVCPGTVVTITFETSYTFVSDNVFTILLSDSSGSFANADTLDTIQSRSGSSITYTYLLYRVPRIIKLPFLAPTLQLSDFPLPSTSKHYYRRPTCN